MQGEGGRGKGEGGRGKVEGEGEEQKDACLKRLPPTPPPPLGTSLFPIPAFRCH